MKENQKVYWLSGLPASGKSTFALDLVKNSNGQVKRVNKDNLRLMLDGGVWSKEREKLINKIQDEMIHTFLCEGYSVVCDNTNFVPSHLDRTKEIIKHVEEIKSVKIEVVEKFFDTPILECIERDAKRGDASVGAEVIYRMWNRYLKKPNPSHKNGDKYLIFDIDGTLAHMTGRSPYDYSRVNEDAVNEPVYKLYRAMRDAGYKIIIFSGRENTCEKETKDWLEANGIIWEHFDMRQASDNRSDTIVKREMFEKIKDKYNVVFVVDDRNSVCSMWRELGLTVLQCDYGFF